MDDFFKMLDENLKYVSHEIIGDTIYITVESNCHELNCSYCGKPSSKVHSHYPRQFQDLPIMGKKAVILMSNRKMFCDNPDCTHKTFAERFSFLPKSARKSQRLKDEILRVALNCSSISASILLSESTVTIGKSAICNLLKKTRTDVR